MNDVISFVKDWLEGMPGYDSFTDEQKQLLICLCSIQVGCLTARYLFEHKDEIVEALKNL